MNFQSIDLFDKLWTKMHEFDNPEFSKGIDFFQFVDKTIFQKPWTFLIVDKIVNAFTPVHRCVSVTNTLVFLLALWLRMCSESTVLCVDPHFPPISAFSELSGG